MGRVVYNRGPGRLQKRVNPQTGMMESVWVPGEVESVERQPLPVRERLKDPAYIANWLAAADRAATLTAPLAGLISRAADQGDMPDNVFELSFRPAPVLATPEDPMAAATARRRSLEDRFIEADIGEKEARTRAAIANIGETQASTKAVRGRAAPWWTGLESAPGYQTPGEKALDQNRLFGPSSLPPPGRRQRDTDTPSATTPGRGPAGPTQYGRYGPEAPPAPQPTQQPKPMPAQPVTQPVTPTSSRIASGAASIDTLEARALAAIQQGDARAAIQVLKDFDDSDGEGVYAESWGDLMTGGHKRRARQRLVGLIGRGLPSEADTRLMEAKIRAAEGLASQREQGAAAAEQLAIMRGQKNLWMPDMLFEGLRKAKAQGDAAEARAIEAELKARLAAGALPSKLATEAEKVLSQRALTEQRKASAKASRASAWASGERARATKQKRQFDKSMQLLRRFKEEAQHEKANYEAGRAYQALQKATADVLARANGGDMTPTARAGIAKTLAGVEGELQEVDALLGLAVDPSAVGAKPEDLVISSDGKTLIKREKDVVGYKDVPDAPGTARAIAKRAGLLKQIEGLRAIVGDISGGGAEVKPRTPIENNPAPVNADTLWD
jgi:hypothetical protein